MLLGTAGRSRASLRAITGNSILSIFALPEQDVVIVATGRSWPGEEWRRGSCIERLGISPSESRHAVLLQDAVSNSLSVSRTRLSLSWPFDAF